MPVSELVQPQPYPYQSPQAQEFYMILERVPVKQWDEVFKSAYYYALGYLQAERTAHKPRVNESQEDYKT